MKSALAAVAVLLVIAACGGLKETQVPEFVNPAPVPSLPPITGPTPGIGGPTPVPSATPPGSASPSPSAAPSAAPTPAPTPSTQSCRLSSMPECGGPEGPPGVYGCCREESSSLFQGQVDAAIDVVRREQPALVVGDRVPNEDAFVAAVARTLTQRFGLCATPGGPADEVGVKSSNNFSEQFDIVFGSGTVRTGGYTVTCRPARF
ncbi:MAG: hypothetical protein AB7O37_09905 [Vicinamibacteria bacterium]